MKNCQSCMWAKTHTQKGGFATTAIFVDSCSLSCREVDEVVGSAATIENTCLSYDRDWSRPV